MSDVVELVSRLVQVPSVNPRERAEPAETPLAELVAEIADTAGLDARLVEVADGRCNAIVTLPGDTEEAVLLESHLDTVEIDGMTVDPFTPTVRDGLLYGRGACDAKGPLAAFLAAMLDLRDAPRRPHTVVLAAVVDEEHRYVGVQSLCAMQLPVLGAVVGEPTMLRMVTAHKGCMRCRVTAHGPGGHSSEPWGKPNPIVTAARAVTYLADEYAPRLDALARPLVGPPSLAVTMTDGGSGPNVLPERAGFAVDRRTVAGEDPHEVWREFRDELLARWPDELTVDEPSVVDYAMETDPDEPFVRAFAETLRRAARPADAVGVGYGTDASKLALDGVPCVVFGPGSIAQAHTSDEYVPVADLHAATSIVRDLLTRKVSS